MEELKAARAEVERRLGALRRVARKPTVDDLYNAFLAYELVALRLIAEGVKLEPEVIRGQLVHGGDA